MTINLQKGQTLSLAKNNPGLSKVFMGLGWDAAKPKSQKTGFLASLFGSAAPSGRVENIDLDASVIVLDAAKNEIDTVSFRKLRSSDGAIKHDGDNLTGDGDGDDEVIHVDLAKLDSRAAHLIFTVNSFRGQTFNEVENAVARLVNDTNGAEICKFTLSEQGSHTGVIMATLSKGADGWKMTAHGVAASGRVVSDMISVAKRLV